MLKDHFIRLFKYDSHMNLQMAELINGSLHQERPAELMAHLLNAQQIWLSRCRGTAGLSYQLWPKWEADTFANIIDENYCQWIDFLNTDPDLQQTIAYKNFKGEEFSNKLVDILNHVINHGTHHRAQIGLLLKQSDAVELPSTDYVHYIRGLQ